MEYVCGFAGARIGFGMLIDKWRAFPISKCCNSDPGKGCDEGAFGKMTRKVTMFSR